MTKKIINLYNVYFTFLARFNFMKKNILYIKVALPIGLDRLFTYQINGYDRNDDLIGRRVAVPFAKRSLTGVVVEFDDQPSSDYQIKGINEFLDDSPVFSLSLLKLAKWVSEYYMCPLGETLKAALPQGMTPKSVVKTSIQPEAFGMDLDSYFKNAPKRKELFEFLKKQNAPVSIEYLQKKLKSTSISPLLSTLQEAGLIHCEQVSTKAVKPKTLKCIVFNPEFFDDDSKFLPHLELAEKKAPARAVLLTRLFELYQSGRREVHVKDLEEKPTPAQISVFEKAGLISVISKEINRNDEQKPTNSLAKRNEYELDLTEEQQSATDKVINAIDVGAFKAFLLNGVTGSGKTLVYLHAIHHVIALGKSALMLVPEIALTPQLIDRFEKVFPGQIAVFHSRMSDGERFDAWRAAQSGEAKIVIGARSGIFAPLKDLGLIIVDEEHESSYKQDSQNPRYNARDTALVRASFENAVVLLGSATPSFESLHNVRAGRYELLEILHRADGAKMPVVKAIDMISAGKTGQMRGSFSKELLDKIVDRLQKKEGVILFQNRRGFASYLECPDCAEIPTCKNCSVTLVFHRAANQLRCHYCGYVAKAHRTCVRCGHPDMREVGSGTQRIEEELAEYMDMQNIVCSIERMDLDTTSAKGSHRAMLERFSNGQTDILIGTQMVAKGLDFDRVTLVGVVNADIQLFLPDFRAGERTVQLLLQVSGRAGRSAALQGEVLIQTAHPNNPAIIHSIENNYKDYFRDEVVFRKNALYPPFSRFCLIEFTCEDMTLVAEAANFFYAGIPRWQHFITLGPILPTIAKLRGKNRRLIVIKNLKELDPKGAFLRAALREALVKYAEKSYPSVKFSIDIDTFSGV